MSKILITSGRCLKEKGYFEHLTNICPPLDLLPISTFLAKSNLENQILDTTFLTKDEFYHTINAQKPTFLVYYVTQETEAFLLECLAKKKEFSHRIEFIICGRNISSKTDFYLQQGADVVVCDTIEEPLTDLLHSMSLPMNPFIGHINGIAYKNGLGEVTKTEPWKTELKAEHFPDLQIENFNFHPYLQHQKSKGGTPHLFFSVSHEQDTLSEKCFRDTYDKFKKAYQFDYIELVANNDKHLTSWLANIEGELPPFEIDFSSSTILLDSIAFPRAQRIWLHYPNKSKHEKIGWIFNNNIKKKQLENLIDTPLDIFHFTFRKESKKEKIIVNVVQATYDLQHIPKSFLNIKKWQQKRKLNKLLQQL